MVTHETNGHHDIVKLSQHEVDRLADRLFARAISLLAPDLLTEIRLDTLLAVACLRVLVRDMPDDGLTVRVWKGGQ